jgi:hypothetical protein
MLRTRGVLLGLLAIVAFANGCVAAAGSRVTHHQAESGHAPRALVRATPVSAWFRPAVGAISGLLAARPPEGAEIQVALSAAHTTTSWDARDPDQQRFDLPLLYLHREREATAEVDRTLDIGIAGLPAAAEIQIQVVSHRVDVSTGTRHRETRAYRSSDRPCTLEHPCTIPWTFDASTTPSDLYSLRV